MMKTIISVIKETAGDDADLALSEDTREVEVLEEISSETFCLESNGNWLATYNECEGISREACESSGGVFDECASACRNDPGAVICTLQCVFVCRY